jgi:hypothetical protein
MIKPITYRDRITGILMGGYFVEYYSLNTDLYSPVDPITIIVQAQDYYTNLVYMKDWEVTTLPVPVNTSATTIIP